MIAKLIHHARGLYSRITTTPKIPDLRKLPPRFRTPDHLNIDYMTNRHGQRMRYAIHQLPDHPPTHQVIFIPGHKEFIEKYAETMHDLADRHVRFAMIEPVGYGNSERLTDNPEKAVIPKYHQAVDHLIQFIEKMTADHDLPTILAGHSRGGLILAKTLIGQMTDQHNLPDQITRAVLFSPMFGIDHHLPGPNWVKRRIRKYIKKRAEDPDHRHDYLPGQGDYHPPPMSVLKKLTSDPVRRMIQPAYEMTRPDVRVGGVTYQWMDESLRATHAFDPTKLSGLDIEIDIAWSDHDQVVDTVVFKTLSKQQDKETNLTLHHFAGGQHELLMETDPIRDHAIELFS